MIFLFWAYLSHFKFDIDDGVHIFEVVFIFEVLFIFEVVFIFEFIFILFLKSSIFEHSNNVF